MVVILRDIGRIDYEQIGFGINTIYEMQLKSISTQVGTIDQINEQTRKMARQIEELNGIYNRMIQALTVNMKHTPGGSITE